MSHHTDAGAGHRSGDAAHLWEPPHGEVTPGGRFCCGPLQSRRLMRQAKLTVQRRKQRHPVMTDSQHGYTVAPNLLARQCRGEAQQVWVGDKTAGG